ncbi:hypothetical protein FOZ62_030764, partial [Perkinsus olseni]
KASDSGLAAKLPGLFFVVVVAVMYIGYLLIAFCLVWHHSRKLPPEGQLSVSDVVFLGLEADRTCAGLAWANGHVRVVYGSADAADGLSSRTIFAAPSLLTEPTVSVTDRFGARGFAKKSPPKQKTKEEKQQSAQRKKDLRDRREADKFLSLEDTKSVGSLTPAERRQQRLDQKMEHANMLKEQTQALDEEVKEMKSALQEVQVEQASPELFRSITVAEKPLLSISQMSIVNATTVNFSVFDDGLAGACQKAIQLRGKNWTISVVLPKVTREVRNECLNRCKGILKKYQRNVNSIKASMLEENRRMMPSTEMEKTEAAKVEKIYKQRADQLVALLREKEQAMSKAA